PRFVSDPPGRWSPRNVRGDRLLAPLVEAVTEWLGVRASAGVITVSPSIVTWMRRRFRLRTPPTLVRNIPHRRGAVPVPADGRLREPGELAQPTAAGRRASPPPGGCARPPARPRAPAMARTPLAARP